MNEQELKPCPFCGSTDILYQLNVTEGYDVLYYAYMYCNKCNCRGARTFTKTLHHGEYNEEVSPGEYKGSVEIHADKEIKEKAIKLWNRRVNEK